MFIAETHKPAHPNCVGCVLLQQCSAGVPQQRITRRKRHPALAPQHTATPHLDMIIYKYIYAMDTLLKLFSVQEILALDAPRPSLSTPAQKRTRDGSRRTEAGRVDKAQAQWQKMLDGARTGQNHIADARSRDGMYFRRRFRMPFCLTGLVQVMLDENWFPKFGKNGSGPVDASGRPGASLHVKVLSALRVIGRGVCIDECFDGSGCGEESIRIFVHDFTAIFADRYQQGLCSSRRSVPERVSARCACARAPTHQHH